ncbi:MAG: TIGR01620 family protein [Marinibacterium sp.]|nr:TIGR01620 family protein [Marinibacterium sp.]
MTNGPILFDVNPDDKREPVSVADAPPVPDADLTAAPEGRAMQAAALIAAQRPSRLSRWFWGSALALVGAVVSVGFWEFAMGLLDRAPLLGMAVSALVVVFLLVCVVVVVRELAALGRLRRVDGLRRASADAVQSGDLAEARVVADRLVAFYRGREDTRWGRDRFADRRGDMFDADALLGLVEDEILTPLDAAARREVEAASRQVATVTALVPLALADVATALASSLRMIRRVAEIYGGRSGVLGSWRLTRAVFAHLVATGAVAAGDDLLEPVLGGSVLSKLSRRFGEGVVNGALSARVGVAAMEVCRPLPFSERHKPSVRGIVAGALGGLFSRGS